jgi:hypothetical protein
MYIINHLPEIARNLGLSMYISIWGFPKIRATLVIIHFFGIFHYHPAKFKGTSNYGNPPSRGTSAFIAASISLCSIGPLGPLGPLGSCCAAMAWLSPWKTPKNLGISGISHDFTVQQV